jgi:hypothetical protein
VKKCPFNFHDHREIGYLAVIRHRAPNILVAKNDSPAGNAKAFSVDPEQRGSTQRLDLAAGSGKYRRGGFREPMAAEKFNIHQIIDNAPLKEIHIRILLIGLCRRRSTDNPCAATPLTPRSRGPDLPRRRGRQAADRIPGSEQDSWDASTSSRGSQVGPPLRVAGWPRRARPSSSAPVWRRSRMSAVLRKISARSEGDVFAQFLCAASAAR